MNTERIDEQMYSKFNNKLLDIYKKHDNKNYQVFNVLNNLVSYIHSKETLLRLLDWIDSDVEAERVNISPYDRRISMSARGEWPYVYYLIGSKQVYRVLDNDNTFRTLDEVYADKIAYLGLINPETLDNDHPPYNNKEPLDIVQQLFQFNVLSKLNDFKEQNNYPKEFSSLYILNLFHLYEFSIPKDADVNTNLYNTNYIKNVIVFKSRGYLKGSVRELEDKGYLIVPIEGVEMDEVYLEENEVDYYYYLSEGMTSQYQYQSN